MATLELINEIHGRINNELLSMSPCGPMNTSELRTEIKERIERELSNSSPKYTVKCDEENNPPNIIDYNLLVAHIHWNENGSSKYCRCMFGRHEQAIKYIIEENPVI